MKQKFAVGLALAASLLVCGSATAASITYTLGTVYTKSVGGADPSGSPTITFDDGGNSGTVTITFDATDLTGAGEFITSWWFNSATTLLVSDFSFNAASTGPSAQSISIGTNDATGQAGNFDILFSFNPSNAQGGAQRFNAGEKVVYTVSHAGITAATFALLSDAGNPDYYSVAHVQGIAPGNTSAHVAAPVPVPAAGWLLGSSLLAIMGLRRRLA